MTTPDRTRLAEEPFLSCKHVPDAAEALAVAHDLDFEVREIANGKRKPGKLSLEKLAIALTYIRRLAASSTEATGEAVRWEYRWTNPGDYPDQTEDALAWNEVVPHERLQQTMEQKVNELLGYQSNGKPCYEVRALGVIEPRTAAPAPSAQAEPFAVKHYTATERPILKGNGFDGLEIGQDREEAQEFVNWVNTRLAAPEGVTDTQRLDFLEREANVPGGILLHDGSEYGRRGYGLRPGSLVRTLREAIDAALAAQQPKEL